MKKLIFFENSLKGRGTLVQIRFFLMLPILALGGGALNLGFDFFWGGGGRDLITH